MAGRYCLTIDLGGTQLRAALADEAGVLHHRQAVLTASAAGTAAIVDQLVDMAREVLSHCDAGDVRGIGLSSPGPLDVEEGYIFSITTIRNFFDVPIVKLLEAQLPYKVHLENDAVAAAIGEWKRGAGQGLSSLVYMTVSTGLGGGIISDGRVVRGRKGLAGHIGHMKIEANGLRCTCGNPGCWEAYASGTNWALRAQAAVAGRSDTVLGANGAVLDAAAIFAAAQAGDRLAQELVSEQADYLGIGIVSLLHLLSPEMIVMGGGVSNGFDQLIGGIRARIDRDVMPAFRSVPVKRAALGGDSGLIGAAMQAFERSVG
jgi:glucokinase